MSAEAATNDNPERTVSDTQPAVYRSTHPDVLAAWEDTQRRHREMSARVRALREEFPEHPPVVYQRNGRIWFSHMGGPADTPPAPEGWRLSKQGSTRGGWVPDKRTKAGRDVAARLDGMEERGMGQFPGMPDSTMSDYSHWHSHGSLVHDGVAYANWSCTFADVESSGWSRQTFDPEMWERCRQSEFWAAKEAHDVALDSGHTETPPKSVKNSSEASA